MHHFFFVAALFALTATSSVALAQVPPDIAEGIRKIGPIVDGPGTAKLYAPLFANQKEPYPNVTVVRDIAYGTDPLQSFDVFTAASRQGGPRPVVVYLHSGGFERGDKHQAGSPFYDNIMLWLARQDMVGVNVNYRPAPVEQREVLERALGDAGRGPPTPSSSTATTSRKRLRSERPTRRSAVRSSRPCGE